MSNRQYCYPLATVPPMQGVGRVVNLLPDNHFVVEHQQRGWHCQRAAGCLLTPEYGDNVLLAGDGQQLWLISVLTRAHTQQPAMLSVAGDLHIAPHGELKLASPEQLHLDAPALKICAEHSECHLNRMDYRGHQVTAALDNCSLVGNVLESVWQRVVQLSQQVLRKVTHTEHVRVGQLDCQAEDYARLHARHMLVTSSAITKIDSEQVHIG